MLRQQLHLRRLLLHAHHLLLKSCLLALLLLQAETRCARLMRSCCRPRDCRPHHSRWNWQRLSRQLLHKRLGLAV